MSNQEKQYKYLEKRPSKEIIEKFYKVSTCMVSDALDKLGLPAGIGGIKPTYAGCKKIVGPAITMKIMPFGVKNPEGHMGADPLQVAEPGDLLVYDNGGRLDQNCWGDILAWSARTKGIIGTIIDGSGRDIEEIEKMGYPLYTRGTTPVTARGRNVQSDYNCQIQLGGIQVNPGDLVMADVNGIVVIPQAKAEEVLEAALDIYERETAMVEEIKAGISFTEVDKKSGYDKMLEKK